MTKGRRENGGDPCNDEGKRGRRRWKVEELRML